MAGVDRDQCRRGAPPSEKLPPSTRRSASRWTRSVASSCPCAWC